MPPSRLPGNFNAAGERPPAPPGRLQTIRPRRQFTARGRRRVRRLRSLRVPLLILMMLAIATTLVLASSLFIPLVLAGFIALGLNPIVAGLHRLYVPRPLGSLLGLSAPAAAWLKDAPTAMRDVGYKVKRLTRPLTRVSHAASQSLAGIGVGPTPVSHAPPPVGFSIDKLVQSAPKIVVAVLTVALLVFFFLSYGRNVAAHLVTAMPGFSYRRIA